MAMYIILFSSMITLLSTGLQLILEYRNSIEQIETELATIENSSLSSLSQSVWVADSVFIETQLDGISANPEFEYLMIEVDGQIKWASGERVSTRVIEKTFPLVFQYKQQQQTIGTLTIISSVDNILNRLLARLLVVLLSNGVKTFFVAGFMLIVFQRFIGRHLNDITLFIHAYDPKDNNEKLVLSRRANDKNSEVDELDEVVLALNQYMAEIELQKVEREDAEKARLKSESLYHNLLEQQSDLISYIDKFGARTFVNTAFCRFTGLSVKQLLRQPSGNHHSGQISQGVIEASVNLTPGQPIAEHEYEMLRSDGEQRWILWTDTGVFNDHGELIGIQAVGRDISERKALETQLRHSQKMEVIGQLTGGVAHDFNNLLGIMMGNTELLGDTIGEAENAHTHIISLTRAIDRASSMTKRLLAFSRQQTLSPKSTALNGLVLGLEDMLVRTLGEMIELKVHLGPGNCDAMIDPNELDSALLNLAINARDAMPEGGVLTIETSNATLNEKYTKRYDDVSAGDYIKIDVRDTGTGMSPDIMDNVFEPFFTTKEFGKGSGLGLSMVYGFVKQSNGHVAVSSEQGEGTTVSLYLPVSTEKTEAMENIEPTYDKVTGRKTILLVEDDQEVREIAVRLLNANGYSVIQAQDGQQALDIIDQQLGKFDLIFTDVVMPNNMSGIDLAEKVIAKHINMKILLTSGYPETIADHDNLKALGIELIAKPYKKAQLIAAIERTLALEVESLR